MKRLLLGLLAFVLAGLVSITAAAVSREDGTAMTAEQDGLLYLYDELGEAKLLQMEEELHLLGFDDVKKKMVKREAVS